jgi:NADPH2:quinone reductase
MRAVQCVEWGGPDRLLIAEIPSRPPGPGEVRLRVRAAGLNFLDTLMIQGKYQAKPDLPFTPGVEVAGEVIAVGHGVTRFVPGARAIGLPTTGGFAEEVVLPEAACHALPDGVGFQVAAGFALVYGTAWHALRDRGALCPGERLLVLGAGGGAGLAAVDLGAAMGARVIAAASSAEKRAACTERGATALIATGTEDLREAIRRTTDGAGPDVVFDPVGGASTEAAFRSIAWRGRHLIVGFASGPIPSVALNLPLLKGAALIGVMWGGYVRREPEDWRAALSEMLDWLAADRLHPLISRTYPLAEARTALADLAARRTIGKVVLVP